ncbi:MAG: nucleotide exchange factor GrpE [Solirubrobacterales bacterium]
MESADRRSQIADEAVEEEEPRATTDPAAPGSGAEEAAGSDLVGEELEELVAGLRAERDEYLDLAQRAKADFENYRKRAARESADAERRAKAALARELVPSVDNLERALSAAEAGSEVARGVELVHGELQATLARAGVESYDATGERFDPTVHEAISTRTADGVEAGTVVETLERGYRLDGQVLRPARVVVSE